MFDCIVLLKKLLIKEKNFAFEYIYKKKLGIIIIKFFEILGDGK